jgi:hypothetical protein
MNQRREDLSTADLAGQQPADTAPPDRTTAAGVQRRDPTDEELRREDLASDERSRGTAVREDRRSDRRPRPSARLPLRRLPAAALRAPRPRPARCWPPRMPRGSGPAGPTSKPGLSTRPGGRLSRPTLWLPTSCSTWLEPSPMSGAGWSANGIAVTTSPPTTSATPSSATARSLNGSWRPDGFRGDVTPVRPGRFWAGTSELSDAAGTGCRQEQARPMGCQPTPCFRQSPECADASPCWRAAPGRDRQRVLLGGVTALFVDA